MRDTSASSMSKASTATRPNPKLASKIDSVSKPSANESKSKGPSKAAGVEKKEPRAGSKVGKKAPARADSRTGKKTTT